MKTLTAILEVSVRRHGAKLLTNTWLLNMLRLAERNADEYERFLDKIPDTIDPDGQG